MGKGKVLGGILYALSLVTFPIILLNLLGGVVSGVWLLVLGQLWALAYGAGLLVVSTFAMSFALLPVVLLSAPGLYFSSKGYRFLVYPFMLLSNVYTLALMTGWCVWVLNVYLRNADERSFLPLLLWSYGTATGPWTYLASKDRDSAASVIAATAAQAGYITMMLVAIFSKATLLGLGIAFGAVMVLAFVLQCAVAVAILTVPEVAQG